MSARSPGLRSQVGQTFRSCAIVVAGTEEIGLPPGKEVSGRVDPYIVLITFPVIFIGELPDKTMFASLVMATKGRPRQVWLGAAGAFVAHVIIAVTIGVTLFAILPKRVLDAVVAGMFLFGAVYAWREGVKDETRAAEREASRHGAVLTAFVVIFLAEWGDLTQILTANLAAKYHSAVSVAVGSILALWTVAALAVLSGQTLLRFVNIATIRKVTAVILVLLATYTAWTAAR
jgi:putative Ca2+/H+ antiporter (TMEM165/GDT1 family)